MAGAGGGLAVAERDLAVAERGLAVAEKGLAVAERGLAARPPPGLGMCACWRGRRSRGAASARGGPAERCSQIGCGWQPGGGAGRGGGSLTHSACDQKDSPDPPHSPTHRRTAPHRTAPHRTTPHSTAPHRTAPHRTAPHRTALHSTAPHSTAQHRTAPHRTEPDLNAMSQTKTH